MIDVIENGGIPINTDASDYNIGKTSKSSEGQFSHDI